MTVFGAIAGDYADVRPDFPPSITSAIAHYAGRVDSVVEIGAGTGTGTAVFRGLADRILCVEPDPRMAARLRTQFPDAQVAVSTFEEWSPPAGGVPLLAAALAWHWFDAERRCALAFAALAPGGVLAVVGRRYGFVDPAQHQAVDAVLSTAWPVPAERADGWIADDVAASGLFEDITLSQHDTQITLAPEDCCRLVRTYSPFQLLAPGLRADVLTRLRGALDGPVGVDMATTLTLARRGAGPPGS